MTLLAKLPNRGVIKMDGSDVIPFLQGLITQDLKSISVGQACYSCLLTPQGKYLYDFFVIRTPTGVLIDSEGGERLLSLIKLLNLYLLRRPIDIEDASASLSIVVHDGPQVASALFTFPDPRDSRLGFRTVMSEKWEGKVSEERYIQRRLEYVVPESSRDLTPQKTIVLEYGFDGLHAFSWTKGCYLGQELMARTKHRGLIRKTVFGIEATGPLPEVGTTLYAGEQEAGHLTSTYGKKGFALLRLEVIEPHLSESKEIHFENGLEVRVIPAHR